MSTWVSRRKERLESTDLRIDCSAFLASPRARRQSPQAFEQFGSRHLKSDGAPGSSGFRLPKDAQDVGGAEIRGGEIVGDLEGLAIQRLGLGQLARVAALVAEDIGQFRDQHHCHVDPLTTDWAPDLHLIAEK